MTDKLLLIEDEAKIARTVRLYLEQDGFQVAMPFQRCAMSGLTWCCST